MVYKVCRVWNHRISRKELPSLGRTRANPTLLGSLPEFSQPQTNLEERSGAHLYSLAYINTRMEWKDYIPNCQRSNGEFLLVVPRGCNIVSWESQYKFVNVVRGRKCQRNRPKSRSRVSGQIHGLAISNWYGELGITQSPGRVSLLR